MTIAQGIKKQVRFKEETTFGVAPTASGAQLLRRVTSDLDLAKDNYQSGEIVTHQQVVDNRHGVRRVAGTINGELSLGTYEAFMAAALRQAWVAGEIFTASDVTAAQSGSTFTTVAGDFLADGLKVGDVIQWTGWTTTGVANNDTNFRITALTSTVMTVAEAVADKASGDSVTATVQGKKTWIPTTGHTDKSYSIEHFFDDLTLSELYLGCKVGSITFDLPPTGMATIAIAFVGQDVTDDTSEYFTTPTTETTTAILAAITGSVRVAGADVAVITSANIVIDCGQTPADPVVGSNVVPDIFSGRVTVSGTISAYFEDATLRDAFVDETEIDVNIKLDATTDADTDCLVLNMSRVKVGGAAKDDGEKGLIQTIPLMPLMDSAGGAALDTLETTISIQDTTLS